MLKLVRNHFKFQKIFFYKNKEIDFSYFEKLQDLQVSKGLSVAPRLNYNHIFFENQKMKVRLATQLLSLSVAHGLMYLKNKEEEAISEEISTEASAADAEASRKPQFVGCEATVQFVTIYNDLFDIFNTSSLVNTYKFKRRVSDKNLNFKYL